MKFDLDIAVSTSLIIKLSWSLQRKRSIANIITNLSRTICFRRFPIAASHFGYHTSLTAGSRDEMAEKLKRGLKNAAPVEIGEGDQTLLLSYYLLSSPLRSLILSDRCGRF
jgi:hypothetical protein